MARVLAVSVSPVSPVPGFPQPNLASFHPPSTAAARVFAIPDLLYTIAFFASIVPPPPHTPSCEIERSRPRLAIDQTSLTSLARTTRAAIPSSYKQLYKSIKLNGTTPVLHDTRLANIVRTLRETDGLVDQVRKLEVVGSGGNKRDEEPNLTTLFALTKRLNHLILSSEDILGWGWDYRLLPCSLTALTLRSVDLARLPSLLSATPNLLSLSFAPQRYRPTRAPEWPEGMKLRELDVQMRCCSTARADPAQDYLLTLIQAVQPTLERLTLTTVDDGCKAHHWGGDDVQVPVLQ